MGAAYAADVSNELVATVPPLSTKPTARERAQGFVRIGARTTLRVANDRDGKAFIEVLTASRDHLAPWMPRAADAHEPSFANRFTRMLGPDAMSAGRERLLICSREHHRIIGACSLGGITEWPMLDCHVGYWLAHNEVGHGFMQDALACMLDHAFESRGLHRVVANIIATNRRSTAVVKALGFSKEGIARALLEINGSWRDHQVWSMLADEWRGGALDHSSSRAKPRRSAR